MTSSHVGLKMKELLRHTVEKVRRDIRGGKFQCFPSLLERIGAEFRAEELGLLYRPFHSSGVRLERRVVISSRSSLPIRLGLESTIPIKTSFLSESVLSKACDEALDRDLQYYHTYFDSEDKESQGGFHNDSNDWLVVVSVWPSSFWKKQESGGYWVYVWSPTRFHPPRMYDYARSVEIVFLINEWFAWKHNRLALREHLLKSVSNDPRKAIESLRRTMVGPLTPMQTVNVARAMVTSIVDISIVEMSETGLHDELKLSTVKEQGRVLVDIASPCPVGSATLTRSDSSVSTVDGAGNCLGCRECPQRPFYEPAAIVVELVLWETEFWLRPNLCGYASKEFMETLKDAWGALDRAAGILDRDESGKPLRLDMESMSLRETPSRERLLLRFFLARAIADTSKTFRDDMERGKRKCASVGELDYLASLASLSVVLMTEDEWTPEAIRTLIRVMAGYGHLILGIPSVIDLARHLRQTLRGESALYTLKQRYRDHFFHTIEVCLIGFSLLRSNPFASESKTLNRWILEKGRPSAKAKTVVPASNDEPVVESTPVYVPMDENDFLRQWWVASLIHDTAYGIDVLNSTLELLDYFQNQEKMLTFHKNVEGEIEKLHEELRKVAPELKEDPTIKKGDHGVIAASHLQQTLLRDTPRLAEQYQPAIRAVAFHNTKYPAVDAARDPVAALLILCDTIQDWGRSQLGYERSATVILSRLVSSAGTPSNEQFGPVKAFAFSMQPQPNSGSKSGTSHDPTIHAWGQIEKKPQMMITLDYSPQACRGTTLFFNWADTTYNLRRVDFRPWGLDIRLQHRLPRLDTTKLLKMTELSKFVYREEISFLEPWVRMACKQDPSAAVCHRVTDDGDWETLTFNLMSLSDSFADKDRLLYGNLKAFADDLSKMDGASDFKRDSLEPNQRSPVVLKPPKRS